MTKAHQVKSLPYANLPNDNSLPKSSSFSQNYSSLIHTLLKKGELSLLYGDFSGMRFFEMAIELDPKNSTLLYEQGLALFEFGSTEGKEEILTLASKWFKRSSKLSPQFFETWHAWGNTLYLLGLRKNEPAYFMNAQKKLEKALQLSCNQGNDILADLYWDIASVWKELAKVSGEISELNVSIQAYEKALSYQDDFPAEFWIDFGDVYLTFGQKTTDFRFHLKAINCYKKGVSLSISSFHGWIKLALGVKEIYLSTHEEDHFTQANECYSAAAQLSPKNSQVWIEWSKLLLEGGAYSQDAKIFHSCIEKCHRALKYSPNSSEVICIWAQVLVNLGILTQNLEFLYEAQNKMEILLEHRADTPGICYSHGICLMGLAAYFSDADYYYQAIERFQEGLTLNRNHRELWTGMALAHVQVGSIDDDEKNYERACRFFEKALHLQKTSDLHFQYGHCLLKYGELLRSQSLIEASIYHFENAIGKQKNCFYSHLEWLFYYAVALDNLAEFIEGEKLYLKAIEILMHILNLKPEYKGIHHQLALTYSHYGELIHDKDLYQLALHHHRTAYLKDKENDHIIHNWAITLINFSELTQNSHDADHLLREAEQKMIQAAKLGNTQAYFSLASLYSLIGNVERSVYFLEKAHSFGILPPIEELIEDDWLDNIKNTEAFSHLIKKIESTQEKHS